MRRYFYKRRFGGGGMGCLFVIEVAWWLASYTIPNKDEEGA